MRRRSAVSALSALGLVTGLLALAPAPAQAMGSALSGTASTLWQTNATVRAMGYANGKIYVGGEFTSVRPPGAAAGVSTVSRTYLAAFDAATGALITSFNPVLNGKVWAITASPDGSRIYVGGDFTTISGSSRVRLAAFSTSTGALDSAFKPSAAWRVSKMAAYGSTLYVVGSFGAVNGAVRNRAAAVNATTGALLAFNPNVTSDPNAAIQTPPDVAAVAVAKDGSRVYLGGRFTTVGGTASYGMAAVDPTSGALLAFPARSALPTPTSSCTTGVRDIVTDATTVYAAASGSGGGCFDGTFAATVATGALKWRNACLGATEALAVIKGWLYKGSHAHDCTAAGSFPQSGNHFLLVQQLSDGAIGPWYPQTNAAGATQVGPLAFATDGNQLFVGGDFTTVNGAGQQGIARFGPTPQTSPVKPKTPLAVSTDRGVVKVSVKATTDLDDENLTYKLYRTGTAAPVATWTIRSMFWNTPTVQYVDSGLTPGAKVSYRVEASDGVAVVASSSTPSVTVASARASYAARVAADGATNYWRLDETSGTAAADSGQTPNAGTYTSVTLGQAGALGSVGKAALFNGSTSKILTTTAAQGPQNFSVEAWIKTTTTRGGTIIGYNDAQNGTGTKHDRQLYMANDGRIVFGVYGGKTYTVRSSAAYNNGAWHRVVGTFTPGALSLYVDGVLQGTVAPPNAQGYLGYWRIGEGSLAGWPYLPSSSAFAGTVDEVAVYGWALSAAAVAAHTP